MTSQLGVAAAIAFITLLGFFVFPGHTWLQSDTQIYVPIFERLWDSSAYSRELIASRPHVAWTIYDETALALRAVTRLPFEGVLFIEQLLFRALAVFGIYLIGRRFAESPPVALFTAAIVSLGATILGPAVLSFEYEPVPRGFAVSLLFCAIGLAIHGETVWASVVASLAFLYHAPTTVPFWIVFALVVLHSRRFAALAPPFVALVLLAALAWLQPGVTEPQHFLRRIPPATEMLQRLRAPYNWVSLWPSDVIWHHLAVWAIGALALFRLRSRMDFTSRLLFGGLPIVGLLSIPISWLLLENMKMAIVPQWQPARAVLLTTVLSVVLACLAAAAAMEERRYLAGALWLVLPFLLPIHRSVWGPYPGEHLILIAGLAIAATAALGLHRGADPLVRAGSPDPAPIWALASVYTAAVFLIPSFGSVVNYPKIHSPNLDALAAWARQSTPRDAVFVFPRPGKDLRPGIFRAKSLRAVYVDWKAGGQVNYFDDLGYEWWARFQPVERGEIPAGVDYVVYKTADAPAGAIYRNPDYAVVPRR